MKREKVTCRAGNSTWIETICVLASVVLLLFSTCLGCKSTGRDPFSGVRVNVNYTLQLDDAQAIEVALVK